MATEISCVRLDPERPGEIRALGGPGWSEDTATVIGALAEGRRYYVRLGSVEINVVLDQSACTALRTDPLASAANELLSLPPCE